MSSQYIYILDVLTVKPYSKSLERNGVYISVHMGSKTSLCERKHEYCSSL